VFKDTLPLVAASLILGLSVSSYRLVEVKTLSEIQQGCVAVYLWDADKPETPV
jgi:hypothetical protein